MLLSVASNVETSDALVSDCSGTNLFLSGSSEVKVGCGRSCDKCAMVLGGEPAMSAHDCETVVCVVMPVAAAELPVGATGDVPDVVETANGGKPVSCPSTAS
jgi:hypothetical protein